MNIKRNKRKEKVGKVVAKSGDKTVSILVETLKSHPLYKKIHKVSKKYLVHDPSNEVEVGDQISVMECRPLSKRKRFRVKKIIKKTIKLGL